MNRKRLAQELLEIASKDPERKLRAEKVLAFAKRKRSSEIHAAIDEAGLWNDKKAAHEARLEFIRQTIMTIYVEREPAKGPGLIRVRLFHSLDADRKTGGGFRTIDDISSESILAEELLETAKRELRSFRSKYANLAALFGVMKAIDGFLNDVA